MYRTLERLDGAASTLVPLAYLTGMLIGTAAYFSGVIVDAGVAVGFALALAVEVHGFLAQRRTRATWAQLARLAPDDSHREGVARQIRANVAILGLLVALSMYNGAAFLARTWPIAPGFLPAWAQIVIRAVILPVLFLASGFLTPLYADAGAVLASASHAMLYRTLRATLKQWRRRIDRASRSGVDLAPVAVALMVDAGDVDGARRIRLIADGLDHAEGHAAGSSYVHNAHTVDHSVPERPPTGPGSPMAALPPGGSNPSTPAPERRRNEPTIRLVDPETPLRRKARRTASAETRARRVLAAQPGISAKALAKAAHVSESTASKWRGIIAAERGQHSAATGQLAQ